LGVDFLGATQVQALQWGRGLSAAETTSSCVLSGYHTWLQWGRGLSAAEIQPTDRRGAGAAPASMGPRPLSRGNSKRRPRRLSTKRTSMGPRPCSRGNDASGACCARRRRCFNGAAAFQPRKCVAGEAAYVTLGVASMGPRLFGRGNITRVIYCEPYTAQLQWGRGFSAAEIWRLAAEMLWDI